MSGWVRSFFWGFFWEVGRSRRIQIGIDGAVRTGRPPLTMKFDAQVTPMLCGGAAKAARLSPSDANGSET